MMAEKPSIVCSRCEVEMNHHANKVAHPRGEEPMKIDPDLDGIVVEMHQCPACGEGKARPA